MIDTSRNKASVVYWRSDELTKSNEMTFTFGRLLDLSDGLKFTVRVDYPYDQAEMEEAIRLKIKNVTGKKRYQLIRV